MPPSTLGKSVVDWYILIIDLEIIWATVFAGSCWGVLLDALPIQSSGCVRRPPGKPVQPWDQGLTPLAEIRSALKAPSQTRDAPSKDPLG